MQKKLLGLQRYQIFNQGRFFLFFFFWGGGGGGCKAIWRIVRISEKILATPLNGIHVKLGNNFTCVLSNLYKMRVKLFPNFTRHHLITHTYIGHSWFVAASSVTSRSILCFRFMVHYMFYSFIHE